GPFSPAGTARRGQGRGNAKAHLDANPAVAKEIKDRIYAALGLGRDLVTPIERGNGAPQPPLGDTAGQDGSRRTGDPASAARAAAESRGRPSLPGSLPGPCRIRLPLA